MAGCPAAGPPWQPGIAGALTCSGCRAAGLLAQPARLKASSIGISLCLGDLFLRMLSYPSISPWRRSSSSRASSSAFSPAVARRVAPSSHFACRVLRSLPSHWLDQTSRAPPHRRPGGYHQGTGQNGSTCSAESPHHTPLHFCIEAQPVFPEPGAYPVPRYRAVPGCRNA